MSHSFEAKICGINLHMYATNLTLANVYQHERRQQITATNGQTLKPINKPSINPE